MDFDMWASLNALQKRQQAQQGAEASAEIAAEIRKLQAMLQEEANKPKCPWCGGGLEKGYEFCKHCGNPVLWVGNLVGKPEQEAEMQAAYLQWQEQKEKQRISKAEQDRRKAEKLARKNEQRKLAQQKQRELEQTPEFQAQKQKERKELQEKFRKACLKFIINVIIVIVAIVIGIYFMWDSQITTR